MTVRMTATKAHAAGISGAVGAALATIVVAVLRRRGVYLGPEVEAAVGVVIVAAIGWIGTYRSPANEPKP